VLGPRDHVLFTAAADSTPIAVDIDDASTGELGHGDRLTAMMHQEAAQVVRLAASEHAQRSRVTLSLLDLPLRPDQLLELIPPELRRNAEAAIGNAEATHRSH
jgi:NAD+ kinase